MWGRVALTLAMRDKADVCLTGTERPVLDEHSTGGVGDCVLVRAGLGPLRGLLLPMISTRLGNTGRTLDKPKRIGVKIPTLDERSFRACGESWLRDCPVRPIGIERE